MKYIIYLVSFLLVGCDVPGKIQIINKSGDAALYRYTKVEPQGDIKVIDIEFKGDKNKKNILFGFGQFWTDRRIQEYTQSLRRVDIITKTDTLTLSGQDEITKFLKDRRGGIFNQTVKIVIR